MHVYLVEEHKLILFIFNYHQQVSSIRISNTSTTCSSLVAILDRPYSEKAFTNHIVLHSLLDKVKQC